MELLPKRLDTPWSSFYWILFAITLFYFLQFTSAGTNETDRLALLGFKAKITDDPLGIMNSWNATVHFCEWNGVTCGNQHQRVTRLNLQSFELKGSISSYIGNLSFLKELFLQNNSLLGEIPPELGRLGRLQYLMLYNNSFGGEIPSNLSRCTSLVSVDLYNNRLVGGIPPEIGFLKRLQGLSISQNKLTGTIPSSMGNLSSLSRLALTYNDLSGRIPDSFGRLKNLNYLTLGSNNLSGLVPPSLFNFSFMTFLSIGVNQLEGSLPSDLATTLPKIKFFSIADNQFKGFIPASVSNLSEIEILLLGANNLQGEVPALHNLIRLEQLLIFENFLGPSLQFVSSLANSTMLNLFEIGDNNFRGSIPESICNFTKLSKILIDDTEISGQIPVCIGNLLGLQVFTAPRTKLSGVIPLSMMRIQSLDTIDLRHNMLTGHIPSTIGNLTSLTTLKLGHNKLIGQIPLTIGNCKNLLQLDLSLNNLSGRIPTQLLSLSSLSIYLDLSDNRLTGKLPAAVGSLKNLDILDVSNNMLSGEIPSYLSACIMLEYLYMEGNSFQGSIPSSLISLKSLQVLNLSGNNISGEIPDFLAKLPLQMLNLSYNDLEGEVPSGGIFSNETGLSVLGNRRLCGGIPLLKLPECHRSNKRTAERRMRLLISIVSVVILLLMVVVVCTLCYRKRMIEHIIPTDSKNSFPNLSYRRLVEATNGFSSANLIGSGTFGVVYTGYLDQSGTKSAIKVFNLSQHGASRSFMSECEVLKNIRHRNLVKVITVCSGVDYQGNDFKAMVYEYMENGSLHDWLHSVPSGRLDSPSSTNRRLNLFQRLDIAADVASALEYLHHNCGAPIVHCDLKPSNILLDGKMVAHIGDFGLAKFLSIGIAGSHKDQSSSMGVRGTIGYTPPEYGLGNEVSTYGDVYSFGILLLEMFTHKSPTSAEFEGSLNLSSFVREGLPERVVEILHPAVVEDIDGGETVAEGAEGFRITGKTRLIMLNALALVLEVALSCSVELPQKRPDIRIVAGKLSSIRNEVLAGIQEKYALSN